MIAKTVALDLTINHLEFTQGVALYPASSANSSTISYLVANRPTFARLTIGVSGVATAPGNVNAKLYASRNGVALSSSPLSAINGPKSASLTPSRANLNDTLNFWLPTDWLTAPLDVYAVVNPDGTVAENSNDNNRYPASGSIRLNFRTAPALSLVVVPLITHINNQTYTPTGPYNFVANTTYQYLPLTQPPTLQIRNALDVPINYSSNTNMFVTHATTILDYLTNLHALEDPFSLHKGYVGFIRLGGCTNCVIGIGWVGDVCTTVDCFTSVALDGLGCAGNFQCEAPETVIHEIGHNLGRRHVITPGNPCSASSSFDGNYPIASGKLDDWGFNLSTQALYDPNNYYDYMGYCEPYWTSRYTFQKIFDFRGSAALRSAQMQIGEALLVTGRINDNLVNVSPLAQIFAPLTRDDPTGQYRAELRDAADHILEATRFNLSESSTRGGLHQHSYGFRLYLPIQPHAARLLIFRGDKLIFEQQANPQLRLALNANLSAQPLKHDATLEWEAAGASAYLARVSYDEGLTWRVLGLQLREPQLKLDLSQLPAGDVWLEVQASDGVRVAKQRQRMRIGQ